MPSGKTLIRDAVPLDIPAVLALCRDGATEPDRYPPLDAGDPVYVQLFTAISNDPNHRLIIVEQAGEIIGTLQLSYMPGLPERGWRGQIENVHVRSDMRGRGIGRLMMGWAISRCRERGCWVVQLTSNKMRAEAHRFYRSLDFKATHEGFKLRL